MKAGSTNIIAICHYIIDCILTHDMRLHALLSAVLLSARIMAYRSRPRAHNGLPQ